MEGQRVLQVGGVGQPPAEPIDRLADDDVEAALSGVGGELLKAGRNRLAPLSAASV